MGKLLRQGKRLGLVATATFLAMALLVGPVAPTKAAEEKVVKVGIQCAFTGGLASTAVRLAYGQFDYITYLNEQGGINGIKIKVLWEDNATSVPRGITAHKRLAGAGIVIETNYEETMTGAILSRLIRDEIPLIYVPGAHSPTYVAEPPWVVGSGPEMENLILGAVDWIKESWTAERPLRIGTMAADRALFHTGYPAVVPVMKERGIEFVGIEYLPIVGVIDSSTEWLRLASKKPDWIILHHYGGNLTPIVKDAARLEIQENGINIIADIASIEESIIKIVGKAAEGIYRMTLEPTSAMTEWPMMKTLLAAAKKYRGYEPEDVYIAYIKGWIASAVAVEGVRLAVEEVGYESLSGRAVRDALFRITAFDTGLAPPITITEERQYYNDSWYFAVIEGGKITAISDWRKIPRTFHYVVTNGEVHIERIK